MNADPNLAKAIFLEAVEQHAPDQWPAFLDRACAGQPDLRGQVEALLKAHREVGTAQHREHAEAAEPSPAAVSTAELPPTERPGFVLAGRYKLVEQVGEGGMGTVWMAQQTEPVKRLVAVKLIKAGMDSQQVIARFEAERQALALMDHPNIAKVLDAGTTAAGRPYFVMDLVKGVPITRYCDEHHLTPRQRLELFLPVCQGVQHAHQKGIIHRDLKPSNVLVALYDGRPVPKVIDFGVAKAAGQQLTDKTLVTGFGAIVGTLEYMSPEQAEVNQFDIDTRSDIYALGVLLYELLAGSPPFSRKDLEKASMLEMLRVIREQEPSKPSTKLSTAEGLPTLAANRGTAPAKLTKLVRGELDWIVMKALEKDRSRRYETANGFALDVQRYLKDEPVEARLPSFAYRFRKFARRNRAALTAAMIVIVSLLAGTAVSMWQARRAIAAERLAQQRLTETESNLRFAMRSLDDVYFSPANGILRELSEGMYKRDFTQRERDSLILGLSYYRELAQQNNDNPETLLGLAKALHRVGRIEVALGNIQSAEESYTRSIELFRALPGELQAHSEFPIELGTALRRRGYLFHKSKQYAKALSDYESAIQIDPRSTSSIFSYGGMAQVHKDLGQYQKALDARNTLLELVPDRASSIVSRAELHFLLGNWAAGTADCRKALGLSPQSVRPWYFLALAHLQGADHDGYRRACAGILERFQESTDVDALYLTAWTCLLGPDAATDWKQPLAVAERLHKADPTNFDTLTALGGILFRAGRFREAAARLTEAEAALKETKSPRGSVIYNWLLQAMTQHRLGDAEKAKWWYEKSAKHLAQPTVGGAPPAAWNRQLTLRLLRQEYEGLAKKK
jgi:serine/threonine protein kinase/tetratricopeptide (TPR) repeat protein